MASERERMEAVYAARGYDTDPAYSDTNPVYLQRMQAVERRYLEYLDLAGLAGDLGQVRVLDYGCGNGRWMGRWLAWGARPENLAGLDIRSSAVAQARELFPQVSFFSTDDHQSPSETGFDLVTLNLVLSSVLSDEARKRVADDVRARVRPGGFVIVYDFRFNNPRNPDVRALHRHEVKSLFGMAELAHRKVVLAPPVARRLIPLTWVGGVIVEAMAPMARTHAISLLQNAPGPGDS